MDGYLVSRPVENEFGDPTYLMKLNKTNKLSDENVPENRQRK